MEPETEVGPRHACRARPEQDAKLRQDWPRLSKLSKTAKRQPPRPLVTPLALPHSPETPRILGSLSRLHAASKRGLPCQHLGAPPDQLSRIPAFS